MIVLGAVIAVAVLVSLPALISMHQNNIKMLNAQRMHSREMAEALIGKKIDWDR